MKTLLLALLLSPAFAQDGAPPVRVCLIEDATKPVPSAIRQGLEKNLRRAKAGFSQRSLSARATKDATVFLEELRAGAADCEILWLHWDRLGGKGWDGVSASVTTMAREGVALVHSAQGVGASGGLLKKTSGLVRAGDARSCADLIAAWAPVFRSKPLGVWKDTFAREKELSERSTLDRLFGSENSRPKPKKGD